MVYFSGCAFLPLCIYLQSYFEAYIFQAFKNQALEGKNLKGYYL
jgi:hypothetical protein